MITTNQDLYYQYSDGKDLLSASIMEREQLLRELENLAKAPQGQGSSEIIVRFDVARAQTLLFELSVLTEKIDSLVVLINNYAEKGGLPRVEMTETKLK
jgi:hypothetical protein